MKRALAAVLATASATVAFSPAPAWSLTCYDQNLTLGGSVVRKVGISDDGDPVYFRARQVGEGRRCTNGTDIGNNTTIVWSAPGQLVNGAWINFDPVWGKDRPKIRVETHTDLVMDLGGRRLGAGQGDRTGGATITVDRRWPADNFTVRIPGRTQG